MQDKPTPDEMRQTLKGDSLESLQNTYMEYADTEEKPISHTPEELIEAILGMMESCDELRASESFKLPDLARELGVDPKVARDKVRRAVTSGKPVPESLKGTGWTFRASDRRAVTKLILPRKKEPQ